MVGHTMASQNLAQDQSMDPCPGACSHNSSDVRVCLTPQKCPSKHGRGFLIGLTPCFLLFGQSCLATRPEILKHEMKVFFVKYNDPIYVKLEKLDIMIRLASQANIAQVSRGLQPGT